MMGTHSQEFTASGTFNVPAGVSCVFVTAIGGGGGGGSAVKYYAATGGGHGGGAAEYCLNKPLIVTPGGTLAITVGTGGPPSPDWQSGFAPLNTRPTTNVGTAYDGATSWGVPGYGGNPTTVGVISVMGGWGGDYDSANVGGMGGGVAAQRMSGNVGAGNTDASLRVDFGTAFQGLMPLVRQGGKYGAGSGGATGSRLGPPEDGAAGGACGPWGGGAKGVKTAAANGGGGGAASPFGPGGDGGTGDAAAPAVPAGSYGAGGGGSGGNSTTYGGPTVISYQGAAGKDGYVLLTWFAP